MSRVGFSNAGSRSLTTTCVTSEQTPVSRPAPRSTFPISCCSMYPIWPWLMAPATSMVRGGTVPAARSERSKISPTCGPFPCVTITWWPSSTSELSCSLMRLMVSRCSSSVPRRPDGMIALPPKATTIVSLTQPPNRRPHCIQGPVDGPKTRCYNRRSLPPECTLQDLQCASGPSAAARKGPYDAPFPRPG